MLSLFSQDSSSSSGAAYFASSILFSIIIHRSFLSKASKQSSIKNTLSQSRAFPPIARKEQSLVYFGSNPLIPNQYRGEKVMVPPKVKVDPYGWLRDDSRERPEVLDYLRQENEYCNQKMAHLESFQQKLYDEMINHLKETDEEVPYPHGDFLYYSRTIKGQAYKIHCRKSIANQPISKEEIILDENKLAHAHDYTDVMSLKPSPDHKFLCYSVDHLGYETYNLRVIQTSSGDTEGKVDIIDEIEGTNGDVVWCADSSAFLYLTMDDEHRPHKVYLHIVGAPQSSDKCLFTENDAKFWLDIQRSADGNFIFIQSDSKETTECWVVDMRGLRGPAMHVNEVEGRMKCISTRRFGVRYEAEHHEGRFYFVTNLDDRKHNSIMYCNTSEYFPGSNDATHAMTDKWVSLRDYDEREQIDTFQPFARNMVITGRKLGRPILWVTSASNPASWEEVAFSEETFSIRLGDNYEFDSDCVRIVYTSFTTPKQVSDIKFATKERLVLKEQEVPGYDRNKYVCRRLSVPSRDGRVSIPVSIVYPRVMQTEEGKLRKPSPMLLYGYGSYGACIDPSFDFKLLSLLDRGVSFAIAHIRGGGEMGKTWNEEEGRYLTKKNTFYDFIDAAAFLEMQGYTTRDQLCIQGRSAGGLLIGATLNLCPTIAKAAVADVPFVDVMSTMSDPTIPLTVTEWEEWGNPNEEKFFDYMLSYSPVDNVKYSNIFPSLLVTAGLNDPRVAYWEPAKWVAHIRATRREHGSDDTAEDKEPILLLKTDMSSGHFSASDRYKYLKETAFTYAFMLSQIDAIEKISL